MAERELFGTLAGLSLVLAVLLTYWLPSFIARSRNHSNLLAIVLFNLFLGWTVVGWIAALIWSATDNVRQAGSHA